jgi:hypothetical protein
VQGQTERQGHTNIPGVWEVHLRRQASKGKTTTTKKGAPVPNTLPELELGGKEEM